MMPMELVGVLDMVCFTEHCGEGFERGWEGRCWSNEATASYRLCGGLREAR